MTQNLQQTNGTLGPSRMINDEPHVDKPVLNWCPARKPTSEVLKGQVCSLEPLVQDHAPNLWESSLLDTDHRNFTYLSFGPFLSVEAYQVRKIQQPAHGRAALISSRFVNVCHCLIILLCTFVHHSLRTTDSCGIMLLKYRATDKAKQLSSNKARKSK